MAYAHQRANYPILATHWWPVNKAHLKSGRFLSQVVIVITSTKETSNIFSVGDRKKIFTFIFLMNYLFSRITTEYQVFYLVAGPLVLSGGHNSVEKLCYCHLSTESYNLQTWQTSTYTSTFQRYWRKNIFEWQDHPEAVLPNPRFTRPIGLLLNCLPRSINWHRYLPKIGLFLGNKTAATLNPVLIAFTNEIIHIYVIDIFY